MAAAAAASAASSEEAIKAAKVLMVGAGGIGCELLKTLALSGFRDIHIIDLDTIEVSNLNRQFLFRQSHVGQSKAKVAREAVLKFRPDINITPYHANVKDGTFSVDFFKQFNVVLNGLDNLDARRHVNRLCLAAEVPLVESGTTGFLGQVTVHVKGKTECYECQPKPVPKSYPVCTITSTPSKFVHCIVWAKDLLFAKLFGDKNQDNDLNVHSKDDSSSKTDVFKRNVDEGLEQYAWRIYDHVFGYNIEVALANEETWKNRKRPYPIYVRDVLSEDAVQQNGCSQDSKNMEQESSAMASLGLRNPQEIWNLADNSKVFLEALKLFFKKREEDIGHLIFDKDDQLAVEFVTAAANIRASSFGIPLHSLFEAKGVAGNIVHAVATTNAIIAGLIVIEAIKVLKGDYQNYRMTYCLEHPSRKMLLMPVEPFEPNKSCYVCSESPLILEVNTKTTKLREVIDKVIKSKLGMNFPSVIIGSTFVFEDGEGLDADEAANYALNLEKALAELPAPVVNGTKITVDDFQQELKCTIDIKHRDEFDEENEPDGMVLAGWSGPAKSILLIDLRFVDRGEYKVLARIGMPGLFETDPFVGADHYVAFCRARFDHFHFSVVTERYLILLDARQPLTPLLAWEHGLESPNNVAMFRLSELRPSKEHDWASNSGFAILVGSFWTGEFNVFCYGPKEQGCPESSHLYAWDLPSRFSLTGQRCSCSNGIMKEVFSMPVLRDGPASQESKNPTIGYFVLPNDLSVLEPSFTGFALIRLTALGKLEMQKYCASADSPDDILCDELQHTSRAHNSSNFSDTQGENFSLKYSLMKLHFLSEYLQGNLCSALVNHDFFVSEEMKQIIVTEEVSEYARDNSSSCPRSVSDFLCSASIPMNIFEIACQRVLNSLPSNILHVTFSNYKGMMLACSTEKTVCEHLDVPTCLTHNKLQPFLLTKPTSISDNLTSKVLSPNALVGPVLPIHVLLAMEERNKDIESSSEGATAETDYVSDRCSEILEAFDPVISIADMNNCNGWSASQEMNDEKSYFTYEHRIENRFTLDESARKKEKEGKKLDAPLHTSATPYQDKIFTTFVCGKAEIPDSGAEQAATPLFDFGPVRMDFEFPGMEIEPAEEKVYRCLKKQFLTWQNNFRPYQDFCSSHKIQKAKQ